MATDTAPGPEGPWFQDAYRIRKKVVALTNQYWIEDPEGRTLGYSKQKLLRLKEDIRVYTDKRMKQELFRIRQTNIADAWGEFAVVDSASDEPLGYLRRKALVSGFVRDEWEIYNAGRELVGGIREETGRGLVRRFVPGGGLVPERVAVTLDGETVAEINQRFKIVGDIWDVRSYAVPPDFDRRVLLSCALLMGMIERKRK